MADSKENLKNEILGAKGLTKRTVTVTWLTSFFSQLLTKSLRNKSIKHSSDQTLLSRRFPLPGQFLWLRYKTCFLYKSNYKEISSLPMTYVSKQTNKENHINHKNNSKSKQVYHTSYGRQTYQSIHINPLTPKISLVILLTISHTVLVMLVWRI